MQLHRHTAPEFKTVSDFNLLPVQIFELDNGIKVHLLEAGSQEVAKIDFLFPAGSIQSAKSLLASVTSKAMIEGSGKYTATEIAEKIDFYGAYIGQQTVFHNSVLTLISLSHFLPETLEILEDIVKHPTFEQKEIDTILERRKQEFLIESDKVKTLASRAFTQNLYGKEHPYGNFVSIEAFDELTRDEIVDFHKKTYIPQGTHIIISGQPGKNIKSLLNKYFGQKWNTNSPLPDWKPEIFQGTKKEVYIPKADALQSAIKIGRPLFNKLHPDFHGIQILNTILGGYFGSRLMTNIREEKGLTYGISSFIMTYKHTGFLVISTDVRAENRELAVEEIFNELKRLREETISEEELTLVRNFLSGDMIRNFDGPFATSDNYRGLIDLDIEPEYFHDFFNVLMQITAEDIKALAQKYLQEEDFITVVAGK